MSHLAQKHYSWRTHLNVLVLEKEGKLLLREKKWSKAEEVFARLIDYSGVFWVYLGQALLGQKKYKSAKECFEKTLHQDGMDSDLTYILFKGLGFCHYYLNDIESSFENFNKALPLIKNKFDPEITIGYGLLFKEQKKYLLAQEKFQEVLEQDMKNVNAWAYLAEVRACLSDFELAYHNLQQALDLDPQNKVALQIKIRWSSHFQWISGSRSLFAFQD